MITFSCARKPPNPNRINATLPIAFLCFIVFRALIKVLSYYYAVFHDNCVLCFLTFWYDVSCVF